jgi:tRNA (guanine-N7-)-methyltransferase
MRAMSRVKRGVMKQKVDSPGLVDSSQASVHPNLERQVRRHLESRWMQPLHRPSIQTYTSLKDSGALLEGAPLILDSGCGTGASTRRLALQFPASTVIGVDQSQARLAKSGLSQGFLREGNRILLRAELATFWRLLCADGITLERHYLLYPNPWPKPGHLARRWHGHPVFPHMLALGGEMEMRCNWEIYAMEFALAVSLASGADVSPEPFQAARGISPFEQKYLQRGQELFVVNVGREVTRSFFCARSGGDPSG